MKKTLKIIFICVCIILGIIAVIQVFNIETKQTKVYAANGSTSDLQLMARAINGEARGEPYEGQVAVRSGYLKPCQKFTISQYDCRSHL